MLTKEAFNALLKTLEEPPQHAVFIFATTEIHRAPATILSRCQRFDFKRIPTKIIISHLKSISAAEGLEIEDDALLQIAKKADGSMRDAQSILDQIISYSGNKITASELSNVLGIINEDLYFEFTEMIRAGDLKKLLLLCNRVYNEGYDLGEFLNGFEEHYRNLLVVKTLGNFDHVNVAEHYHENYLKEVEHQQENDLLAYIKQIGEMQNEIKWSSQANLKFEIGILKMAKMPTTVNIETLLEKIDLLKKKTEPLKSEPTEEESNLTEVSLSSLKQAWPELTAHFRETKVNLANALEIGEIKTYQDSDLTIEYANTDVFHSTWLTKNKRLVEEALYQKFSSPVKLVIANVDKPSKGINNGSKRLNNKQMLKQMENDPVLNKLIDELGLEIT
jgi:DNA polymerase-3 subunit gamma/tau